MAAGQFDILADQGANYVLYFTYEENNNSVIDLTNYNGRMQVRRSAFSNDILLSCAGNTASGGVTGGGVTGSFTGTGGVAGSGTMLLNASAAGLTGANGASGGVFVSLDATSMYWSEADKEFVFASTESSHDALTVTKKALQTPVML